MKIVVLQGSPNLDGSTAMLVEEFSRGAREAGHEVVRIDVAEADVAPCTGCVACGYEGPCVLSDGMDAIRDEILSAGGIVFATPLYYFGMSAQLKIVIDRFCSANSSISSRHLKCALLTVAWRSRDWTFEALVSHYRTVSRYLHMDDRGMVLGYGCGTPDMTAHSDAMRQAYELGRSF